MYGVEHLTAIINPPEAAILDGAVGARFLADLTALLENPWLVVA